MLTTQEHRMGAVELLGLADEQAIIAVVGCGGKTTLINQLAHSLEHRRVLITPTTKIRAMLEPHITSCYTLESVQRHQARVGIQCLGLWDPDRQKVRALPADLLASIIKDYDVVLLEADGSRGLPCKAWAEHEPVVPSYVTHTIGVMNLQALYQPADEKHLFNLELFLQKSDLAYGDAITLRALFKIIRDPLGLWKGSQGKKVILLNQVEDDLQRERAEFFLRYLRQYLSTLDTYAYGSAKSNLWKGV